MVDSPRAVERHLQRLEDAVGGNQKQKHGSEMDLAVHLEPCLEVPDHELARLAGERIADGQVDGLLGRPPVEDIAAERRDDDEKRIG